MPTEQFLTIIFRVFVKCFDNYPFLFSLIHVSDLISINYYANVNFALQKLILH